MDLVIKFYLGTLLMKDGTVYYGEFQDDEITGKGHT